MAKADAVAQSSDWQVVLQKAADLAPYARNTRTHSDEQVAAIMGSIVEFGFTKPVLVDKSGIIAGHGAVLAALRLYETDKEIRTPSGKALPKGYVPTIDCSGWSEAQRKAYIIADNALADRGGWDREQLLLEIGDLEALKFDTSKIGWDPEELSDFLYPAERGGAGGGDGEPPSNNYAEQYGCVVVCDSAAHQEEVYEALKAEGYNVKVVVT